jgi:hypothetical protein
MSGTRRHVLTVEGVRIEIGNDGDVAIEGAKSVDIRHVFEKVSRGSFFKRTLNDRDDTEYQMIVVRTDMKDIQKIGVEICGMNEPWPMVERPRMDVQIGYANLDPDDDCHKKIKVIATEARTSEDHPPRHVLGEMDLDQYVDRGRREAAKQAKVSGLSDPPQDGDE